jgi:hypothetical protein
MSDEEKNTGNAGTASASAIEPPEQPSLDEHTTEPNAPETAKPAPSQADRGKWQMPKPKFQQTSGYLPQGYLKDVQQAPAGVQGFGGSEDTTQEQAPYIPSPPKQDGADGTSPAIEPQPDLADLIPDEPVVESTESSQVQVKSGSGFPILALGLVGVLIFVVVFLVAVYFLFLAKPSGGTNF